MTQPATIYQLPTRPNCPADPSEMQRLGIDTVLELERIAAAANKGDGSGGASSATPEPEPQPEPDTMPHKEPHRMTDNSTYCHNVTTSVLRSLLLYAQEAKRDHGTPYHFEAACMSYMLDTDRNGKPKRKADYQRIWGWSERMLRTRWDDLIAQVEGMRTLFGRLKRDEVETERRRKGDGKQPDSEAESQSRDGRETDERRSGDGHTIQTIDSNTDNTSVCVSDPTEETAPDEGGGKKPEPTREELTFNPGYALPTLEEVQTFAATKSIPPDEAESIFYSFAKESWKGVTHWGYAVIDRYRYRQSHSPKPKQGKGNGSHTQPSDGNLSFTERVDAELRRTTGQGIDPARGGR